MVEGQELIFNLITYGNFQICFDRGNIKDALEVTIDDEEKLSINYKRSYFNYETGEWSESKLIKQYDEKILPYYLSLVLISSCNDASYANKIKISAVKIPKSITNQDNILKICFILDQLISNWQVKDMVTFVKSSDLVKVDMLMSKVNLIYSGNSSLEDLVAALNKKLPNFCALFKEFSFIYRNLQFTSVNIDLYRKWHAYKNDESDLLQLKK